MSKNAEEAAIRKYPIFLEYYPKIPSSTCGPDGFTPTVKDHNAYARQIFREGYEQAEENIISIIESRISEIIGDAQPAPVLRAELRELIEQIKRQEE